MAEIKIVEKVEDGLYFTDGFSVTDYHEQDCCEHVYADWDYLKEELKPGDKVDVNNFEIVAESGFRIGGYFVPCYNSQNGYYSNELILVFETADGWKKEVNITDGVKDDID